MLQAASYRSHGLSEFINAQGLIDHLFPDAPLPIPAASLADDLTTNPELYSSLSYQWISYPSSKDPNEFLQQMCMFLNKLGGEMIKVCAKWGLAIQEARVWGLQPPTSAEGSQCDNTPELVLVEMHGRQGSPSLAHARQATGSLRSMFLTASSCLTAQDNRRFYLCLEFLDTDVRLLFYDHCRFAASEAFNVHQQPFRLVRLLAALMLGHRHCIGEEPSVDSRGQCHRLVGVKQHYTGLQTLYVSPKYPARGTVVWRARGTDGVECAVKDIWERTSFDSEMAILSSVEGLPGLPQVHAVEAVDDGNYLGLRGLLELGNSTVETPRLVHRRVAMTPCAEPLVSARDLVEFLSVMMDVISAHYHLFAQGRILHRNVGIPSIMMFEPSANPQVSLNHCILRQHTSLPLRAGLLISLGHAVQLGQDATSFSDPECLHGSYPYLAVELLLTGPKCPHHVSHDLESFFWVLCAVAVGYTPSMRSTSVADSNVDVRDHSSTSTIVDSPGGRPHRPPLFEEWELQPDDKGDYRRVALRKWYMVCSRHAFGVKVLSQFLPQFRPLVGVASDLREWFFGSHGGSGVPLANLRQNLSHQALISLFRRPAEEMLQAVGQGFNVVEETQAYLGP